MAGCREWFRQNAEADKWAAKIEFVEMEMGDGIVWLLMKNAPCWKYTQRNDADEGNSVTKVMTTYSGGCWYGVCRHHGRVYTSIFQERVKGQYHFVGGLYLKAMYVVFLEGHAWADVYIKDKGYYICDVCTPQYLVPRSSFGSVIGDYMCNQWVHNGSYTHYNCVPFQPLWAGPEITPPSPPKKSYIKATSSPSAASIWLKRH